MTAGRMMKIGLFLDPSGRHVASWRHPQAHPRASVSLENFTAKAKLAEAMKLDFLFIADNNNVWEDLEYFRRIERASVLDPMMLLASLAAVTTRVGLVSTVSTSFLLPFHIARAMASLDHLSDGRAGWNLVTSMFAAEAKNFGSAAYPDHAKRYERAEEFVDVVTGLWNSFDNDAFPMDKDSGIFVDTDKMHLLHHQGAHFAARGPLNLPRSAQGQPVIVQAGSSGPGRELAARTAEVVFSAQQTLAEGQAFYADVKTRMARHGRDPEEMKILPGVSPIIGETEAEAREKFEQMQALIHPAVGISLLSNLIGGFDLSAYDVDGPVPELPLTSGGQGRQQVLVDKARREKLTIRQLYQRAVAARGHWQPVGTVQHVADQLEEQFRGRAADGFNLMTQGPTDLAQFAQGLIPELQRRGLFRTEYEGPTLRHQLGLLSPKPRKG